MTDTESSVPPDTYIRTATHNYVSRRATVEGPSNVELKGKSVLSPGVVVRGDLAVIRMGRYCTVHRNAVIRPAPMGDKHVPMVLRGNVVIEDNSVVEATAVGTNVRIGKDCVIGKRVILKDCCWVEDGTVLGDDTVVPPFSRVQGKPGMVVEELPPSAASDLQDMAQEAYQDFLKTNPAT